MLHMKTKDRFKKNIFLHIVLQRQVIDIYIKRRRKLVWFFGKSIILCYLMPNATYSYILDIYDL